MEVYRISQCRYIDDLSGWGAAHFPGRWNSKGIHVLYSAQSGALALLENIVNNALFFKMKYCCLKLKIPDSAIATIDLKLLPEEWNQHPAPEILRKFGDAFVLQGRYLALKVPSAILPDEWNYLINPGHPLASDIEVLSREEIGIDHRLLSGSTVKPKKTARKKGK